MQYELVSRALAYVSCLSTLSLFMTSMAIAAVNVGKVRPLVSCAAEHLHCRRFGCERRRELAD